MSGLAGFSRVAFRGTLPAMGNFYANIVLRKVAPDAVAALLSELGRKAYLTTQPAAVVCVYEERIDQQDLGELSDLCEQLSGKLQTVAWGVLNHDDDVLYFELWDRGECLDEYCSNPDFFAEAGDEDGGDEGAALPTEGGDGEALAEAFDVASHAEAIQAMLDRPDAFMFAFEQHLRLGEQLGIPEDWLVAGFNSLSLGEIIPGLGPDGLLLVGV